MFFQTLERQDLDDAVIEQAAVAAALALVPTAASGRDAGVRALTAYLASPLARQRPTALFQLALQLPAAACIYSPDAIELPSRFSTPDFVADGHKRGQTDTYAQLAVSGSKSYKHATATGDCEDRGQFMIVLGFAAQAYLLRHLNDAPGTLGALVARALQPLLAYVPAACLVAVDSVEVNGHMIGLFVHRRLLPPPCRTPPWGAFGAVSADLPAAVYMDATYLTVDTLCTEVGASTAARLWDALPDPSAAIENAVNAAGVPWSVKSHPSNDFVAARIFTDVRAFAPTVDAWAGTALEWRDAQRLVPIWVPCDKRQPGTFGVRLRDLCEDGDRTALLQACPCDPRHFAEMLLQLAWRHPPVGVEMRVPADARCEQLVKAPGSAGAPDLALPVLLRDESYDAEHKTNVLKRVQRTCKRDYSVWLTRATLNDVSGAVDILTVVA